MTNQDASAFSRADLERIDHMQPTELNALPFGAIQLDAQGTILRFNDYEAKLTGRKPEKVIGRNFFQEVAPCTNVREFAGKFHEGIKKKDLHEVFPYMFDFKMAPRNVTVTLFYNKANDTAWVFVREIAKKP
jgi:photoactive yellow protein